MTEAVPDETMLCKFRHLLEGNGLNKLFFDSINRVMVQTGHMMKGGTIVDATIINAPSSTKNAEKSRDPEMHQTKKGNGWRFGMKCHAGVDAGSGLVHTITVTAANVHDITQTENLLREDDKVVYGDSGYLGVENIPKLRTTSIFHRLTSALTAAPISCLLFLTIRSTGNGILKTANPPCAARWSMHSKSSNAGLAIRKRCTEA